MKWRYWITLYLHTHSAARGLRSTTIAAYEATLRQFVAFVEVRLARRDPDCLTARDVLEYLTFLRQERDNGDAAVNRQVVVLRNFYRAIVALGHLEPEDNPLAHFPTIKAAPRKLPVTLSEEEVRRLLEAPPPDTVLHLRDRGLLALLYGTGIRASECATVTQADVDLAQSTVTVVGKGGHQRCVPLNEHVVRALAVYRKARGPVAADAPFFQNRRGGALSRGAIYERVRKWAQAAKIEKTVSPHRLRHTFATHLVRAGVGLVTIRDLPGHRQISSTQIYLHVTAHDLRAAAERHPIQRLGPLIEDLLPTMRLPKQYPPRRRPSAG